MRDILATCLTAYPGAANALRTLADATGRLHVLTLTGRAHDPARMMAIEMLRGKHTRLLVVGGASPRYEALIATAHARGIPVAVYWTSSASQTGFGPELAKLIDALEDRRVTFRWMADAALAATLTRKDTPCAWLPLVHEGRLAPRAPVTRPRRAVPQLSLFCSPLEYARKNIVTTLLAVKTLDRPVVLHLNGLSRDRSARRLIARLGLQIVEHGWMTADAYAALLPTLTVGLQVSLAESYNFVAAEHLLAGVPVVVSPMVPAIADLPRPVRAPFVTARPDDPMAIADIIQNLLAHPAATSRAVTRAQRALLARQRQRVALARRVLKAATA